MLFEAISNMKIIPRHAQTTLERLADEFPAVLITGARQTGKTTLLKEYTSRHDISGITFDDPGEEFSAKSDPRTFMRLHPAPFMFDEVQYVPELFRYIKIDIDSDRHPGMFFFTGSQQLRLGELASESLSGRIGILHLYPLSQREITGCSFHEPFLPDIEYIQRRKSSAASLSENLWSDILNGGYPEVVRGNVNRRDFYENYLKTYIERDIRSLANISDEVKFLQFIRIAAARTGNLLNYQDLSNEVGISETTAKKWMSLLTTSGLVYLLRPFSMNVEKRVVKTPKLYFIDTGLASYLTGWHTEDVLMNGAMAGAFFETFCVGEILKSFANAGMEAPMYFYRDKDKTEIDLILYENGRLYPVEIKKTASPNAKDAKNFYATGRIKGMDIADPVIICNCDNPIGVKENVLAIPIGYI